MNSAKNPNLWANPTNRTAKLWNLTWDQILAVDGAVWKSIVGSLVTIFAMTILNKWDLRGGNIVFAIFGYLYIWWIGLKPTHLLYSGVGGGIFAALFDQDKSQGVGNGPRILFNVVQSIAYTYLLISFTLITWDFSESITSFWVAAIGIIIITQTSEFGGWRNRIIVSYAFVCIIAAIWMTFGGSWRGEAFDPVTGAPLHMVDPVTGNVDSLKRSPAECKVKTCYSAETGQALRPMTYDEAIRRNPLTALGAYASDAKAALPTAGAGEKTRATTDCGKDVTWEASKEERTYPKVQLGCTQRFITSYRGQLHLHAMDKRLDGEPSKYFVIKRPSWEVIEITPKKSIPTGLDPVTITLVTTEESIDIKNKILADDEALKKAAGL